MTFYVFSNSALLHCVTCRRYNRRLCSAGSRNVGYED